MLAGMAFVFTLPSPDANAGRRLYEDLSQGYVVAYSRYSNGSVTGRIRHRKYGPQVQLPGGNWEYCRRSCSETLRVETIDRWEPTGALPNGFVRECGIFGCLDFGF